MRLVAAIALGLAIPIGTAAMTITANAQTAMRQCTTDSDCQLASAEALTRCEADWRNLSKGQKQHLVNEYAKRGVTKANAKAMNIVGCMGL